MAKMIQFRYYGAANPHNYIGGDSNDPADNAQIDWRKFCADQTFRNFVPIHQFGIQTLPGTKIYLNQSLSPIVIGGTGMYEINCDNTTANLTAFRVAEDSMETINKNPNGYLIIDLVYGEES